MIKDIFFNEKYSKNTSNFSFFKLIIYIIIIFIEIILYIYIKLFHLRKQYNKLKNEIYFLKKIKKYHKIVAISYANKNYSKQLEMNKKSAIEVGNVDEYYSYGPEDIDIEFKEKNKDILSRKRGNGYWLWKPYFILKTFKEKLKEGDFLIYTDAATLYMNSTHNIINFLNRQNEEMWMFRLNFLEKSFTKRDAFILLGADMPFYTNTPQYMATIQIYRKSKFTEKFLEELLYYSQDRRIITDEPNTLGFPNYENFYENRHDQSILSILIKKYGQCNSGKTNIKNENNKKDMPYIFCVYRRLKFYNYEDIKEKCIKYLKGRK